MASTMSRAIWLGAWLAGAGLLVTATVHAQDRPVESGVPTQVPETGPSEGEPAPHEWRLVGPPAQGPYVGMPAYFMRVNGLLQELEAALNRGECERVQQLAGQVRDGLEGFVSDRFLRQIEADEKNPAVFWRDVAEMRQSRETASRRLAHLDEVLARPCPPPASPPGPAPQPPVVPADAEWEDVSQPTRGLEAERAVFRQALAACDAVAFVAAKRRYEAALAMEIGLAAERLDEALRTRLRGELERIGALRPRACEVQPTANAELQDGLAAHSRNLTPAFAARRAEFRATAGGCDAAAFGQARIGYMDELATAIDGAERSGRSSEDFHEALLQEERAVSRAPAPNCITTAAAPVPAAPAPASAAAPGPVTSPPVAAAAPVPAVPPSQRPAIMAVSQPGPAPAALASGQGQTPASCALPHVWRNDVPGLSSSTWTVDSSGQAEESGMGGAKGTASFTGASVIITWETGAYAGYYEIALDDECNGEGELVRTLAPGGADRFPATFTSMASASPAPSQPATTPVPIAAAPPSPVASAQASVALPPVQSPEPHWDRFLYRRYSQWAKLLEGDRTAGQCDGPYGYYQSRDTMGNRLEDALVEARRQGQTSFQSKFPVIDYFKNWIVATRGLGCP